MGITNGAVIQPAYNMNRSAFTRKALRDAVAQYTASKMEEKYRQGSQKYPGQG